jgi:hypothetical protein
MPVNDVSIDLFVFTMAKKALNLNAPDNIIALLTVQNRCRRVPIGSKFSANRIRQKRKLTTKSDRNGPIAGIGDKVGS